MDSSDESGDRKRCSSVSSSLNKRNIQFFDRTGKSLVHPRSYTLQTFQKEIIQTALLNNTLISLPPGLGKLFIAAVITLNFHRWFLNSKIVILSQARSYLTDLLNAFNDYTSISKDVYSELLNNSQPKDYGLACKKPILLTSPQKLIELMKDNTFKIQNVVLLIIFESTKILKCQEYQQILDALSEYEYRSLVFIDPIGFNPKSIRQVVEQFNISKFQVKNCDSEDIRQCTYFSKVDHIIVDISKPISNIKDSFFAVLEKYSRILKDAKIISGNVTTLTRLQILKMREKMKKNPPLNMPQAQRDNLTNSLTICAFLCQGLELLHNWGMRIFYEYLFDEDKDPDVKALIAKDEDLKSQMKDLHKYLEMSAKKIDTSPLAFVHPKLIRLKEVVNQRFEKGETNTDQVRIIVLCPAQVVVDEIERLFRNLPDAIRYHCIKTNATCLANEPEHKEIVKTFMEGVISVLVLSNLVDEILEVEASLIISLDPCKTLLKTSDPRFFKGTPECLFIVTRGTELNKFEELHKETKNDQKSLEVSGIEIFLQESPRLFPGDFDPEFECSDITEPRRNFKTSPTQKTLHRYLKPSQDLNSSSPSLFDKIDPSLLKWVAPKPKNKFSEVDNSISLFSDTFENTSTSPRRGLDALDMVNDDLVPMLPIENKRLQETCLINPTDDLSEELIFDISKTVTPTSKSVTPESARPALENTKKFSAWTKKSLFPSKKDKCDRNVTELKKVQLSSDDECPTSPVLGFRVRRTSASSPPPMNQFVTVAEVHRDPFDDDEMKKAVTELQNESFADFLFSDSSSEDKRASQSAPTVAVAIDYDKIEVDTSYDAKSAAINDSFFDDLFVDSDPDPKPATANKSKTRHVEEFDSDVDIVEDSPTAKRRCKMFSSRSIESATSQTSQKMFQRPKRRLYNDSTTEIGSSIVFDSTRKAKTNATMTDTFDDIIGDLNFDFTSTVDKSNSSRNAKANVATRNSLVNKSREFGVNHDSTPTKTSRFVSASNPPSVRSTSPVLFSARTASRDRTRVTSSYNQSSSMKFESTFDVSDNRSLGRKNMSASEPKAKNNFSDSLFDDDDGVFGDYNISDIERAATRNNVESSKDSGFVNTSTSKSLREYSASTPKTRVENVRTPEQSIIGSNESTPDSIVLDGYSTPENVFTRGAQSDEVRRRSSEDDVLRLGYTPPEMSRGQSQRNAKQSKLTSFLKNKSIAFSDSSLSLGDFTTPDAPSVKGRSPAFNSDTAMSVDRSGGSSVSKLSTMDVLNAISANKEETRAVKNSGNSRFAFLKSSNKNNNSLFRSTLKQRIENKKRVQMSEASPASKAFEIVDSDEELAWLDTSPINAPSFRRPEALTKTTPVSRHSSPLAARKSDYETSSNSTTPEQSPVPRKRSKLKRKIFAEQFIDVEAEVSGDDEYEDEDECSNASHLDAEMASFIDDDTEKQSPNMANYLKSIKSPENASGKYYIPELSESRLKINVCSQMDDYEQSYQQDSFCVNEASDSEANEYAPSVLTQMERKLERKRKSKNCVKSTKRTFKRIVQHFSSPDSPQTCNPLSVQRCANNRKSILSSDSDDAE